MYGNKYKTQDFWKEIFWRTSFSIEDYSAVLANFTQTSYFLCPFCNAATLVVCNGVHSLCVPVNLKPTDFIWLSSIFWYSGTSLVQVLIWKVLLWPLGIATQYWMWRQWRPDIAYSLICWNFYWLLILLLPGKLLRIERNHWNRDMKAGIYSAPNSNMQKYRDTPFIKGSDCTKLKNQTNPNFQENKMKG